MLLIAMLPLMAAPTPERAAAIRVQIADCQKHIEQRGGGSGGRANLAYYSKRISELQAELSAP